MKMQVHHGASLTFCVCMSLVCICEMDQWTMYFSEMQEPEPSVLPATKGQVKQRAADIQRQLEVGN